MDWAVMPELNFHSLVLTFAGSPLCGSHVVDAGERSSPNEGNHFQRAPMGGHAWSLLLQGSWGGENSYMNCILSWWIRRRLKNDINFVFCIFSKCRLRRRNKLQLRRLLERRSSRVNGVPPQPNSPSLRWLTGLRVSLCHPCPFSSSLQVKVF